MPDLEKLSAAKFRAARLLLQKKHRLREGKCLIEGRRFVGDALQSGAAVDAVFVTGEFASRPEGAVLIRSARKAGAAIMTVTGTQLAALSDTVTAQGVVAVVGLPGVPMENLHLGGEGGILLVGLDGVSDPGNVGTIIRTCAWFGADGIILGEGTADLSNPKVLRSTMGAVFRLPVVPAADLSGAASCLKKRGFRVITAEPGGSDADDVFGEGPRVMVIFGSEAHGIGADISAMADARYGIPKYGIGESLNVSVAVAVTLDRYRSGGR